MTAQCAWLSQIETLTRLRVPRVCHLVAGLDACTRDGMRGYRLVSWRTASALLTTTQNESVNECPTANGSASRSSGGHTNADLTASGLRTGAAKRTRPLRADAAAPPGDTQPRRLHDLKQHPAGLRASAAGVVPLP